MKATFIGVPGEKHDSIHMYGQDFPLNKAVEVNTLMARRKLANHPHFKTEGQTSDSREDASIKREFSGATEASLADAQARQAEEQQRAVEASDLNRPSTAVSPADRVEALRSAQEYQERVERGPAVPGATETTTQENANADADAQRTGRAGAAQAEDRRPPASGQRGQAGKGR